MSHPVRGSASGRTYFPNVSLSSSSSTSRKSKLQSSLESGQAARGDGVCLDTESFEYQQSQEYKFDIIDFLCASNIEAASKQIGELKKNGIAVDLNHKNDIVNFAKYKECLDKLPDEVLVWLGVQPQGLKGEGENETSAHTAATTQANSSPAELEETIVLANKGTGRPIQLRPIKPEDEQEFLEFFGKLSDDDKQMRFHCVTNELSAKEITDLTHIDYDSVMAFVARRETGNGKHEMLAEVRTDHRGDGKLVECAMIVRSDLKKQGLGTHLMNKAIAYCRSRGAERMVLELLSYNIPMKTFAQKFGFVITNVFDTEIVMTLDLQTQTGADGLSSKD